MKYFVCIDDTDNADSIGTGQLLEEMCFEAKSRRLGKGGFIVRYQLFIHDDIPYTSHNSSMCIDFETDAPEEFAAFAADYLEKNSAEGSDPGLCILKDSPEIDYSPLFDFGIRATKEIVTKEEAYAAANAFGDGVRLSEHGGTGLGVIGALAGAALRAGRAGGRIKGKLFPPEDENVFTFKAFAEKFGIGQFVDEDEKILPDTGEKIEFFFPTKKLYIDGKVTAMLVRNENGVLIPKPKKGKKKDV
ncbi:MAG: hypothetical protein IKH65_04685 [Clostridia bacterium]|nr:hypothetical protein [Clostridia bacterium]